MIWRQGANGYWGAGWDDGEKRLVADLITIIPPPLGSQRLLVCEREQGWGKNDFLRCHYYWPRTAEYMSCWI